MQNIFWNIWIKNVFSNILENIFWKIHCLDFVCWVFIDMDNKILTIFLVWYFGWKFTHQKLFWKVLFFDNVGWIADIYLGEKMKRIIFKLCSLINILGGRKIAFICAEIEIEFSIVILRQCRSNILETLVVTYPIYKIC